VRWNLHSGVIIECMNKSNTRMHTITLALPKVGI
jgi:hypothetical protein